MFTMDSMFHKTLLGASFFSLPTSRQLTGIREYPLCHPRQKECSLSVWLNHFFTQEPYFVEFLEWIENEIYSEEHFLAVQEMNIPHEDRATNVAADHENLPTPQRKNEAQETRAKYLQL